MKGLKCDHMWTKMLQKNKSASVNGCLMCPISSGLSQNSFFFSWLQTLLCHNLKKAGQRRPLLSWLQVTAAGWPLSSWERLSCSNLQMVWGESRTGHGEGWRRWCHRPRDNPGGDVVSLRQGISRSYVHQLWLDAATGVTEDSNGKGKVQHGQFESVQYSDKSGWRSQGFSSTTEDTGWTFSPSKDKCDNFINLPFSPHVKPVPAFLWELSTLPNKRPFFSSQRTPAAKFFGHFQRARDTKRPW